MRFARPRVARHWPLLLPLALAACTGLTDVPDPSTIIDPNIVHTEDGAVSLYHASASMFATIYAGAPPKIHPNFPSERGYSFVLAAGFAGDEFSTESFDNVGEYFMQRLVGPESGRDQPQPYSDLHTARLNIDQAIGALREYGTTTPKSYLGELFVMKGYLYVMFGEMYCSGIPFTRTVYGGDLILGHPETTQSMFEDAVAQFDTAMTVTTDSVRIQRIAAIGKARALLNLGRFTDAAAAVPSSVVPTNYSYAMTYSTESAPNFFGIARQLGGFVGGPGALYMGNRLGTNGLNYIEAGDLDAANPDPRVAWTLVTSQACPFCPASSYPLPDKYPDGATSVVVGNGIEARLIEAEAKLQANDIPGWAAALNDLREHAITPAIPDLRADSTTAASDTLRENVMFRERAFWLYGTGHRLGDLRRVVRQYHRAIQRVFPTGKMFSSDSRNSYYVDRTNFAPPVSEENANPYFHGCLNRDP